MYNFTLFFYFQLESFCISTLKSTPIILLAFIVPVEIYGHEILFSDDFNRADNEIVGNGWKEKDGDTPIVSVKIKNNAMEFIGSDTRIKKPCVLYTFNATAFPYLQINYNQTFAPVFNGSDDSYAFQFRAGENVKCINTSGREIQLMHGSEDNIFQDGGFGHVIPGNKVYTGTINGTVTVSILANNNTRTYEYTVSGPGLIAGNNNATEIPYYNNQGIINKLIFYENKMANTMPPVYIDDVEIIGLTAHPTQCGIVINDELSFGLTKPGLTSGEGFIDIVGTGERDSQVSVFATDWLDTTTGIQIINDGENTRFGLSSDQYNNKTPLNSTDAFVTVGTVPHHGSLQTYWQSELKLNDETFKGDITQTMTFEVQC